jgi:hypothetical protein
MEMVGRYQRLRLNEQSDRIVPAERTREGGRDNKLLRIIEPCWVIENNFDENIICR